MRRKCMHEFGEPLEPRRMLSFTVFGSEGMVPATAQVSRADVAMAGNGSFIVAQIDGDALEAVRYSATGEQVGEPLVLDKRKDTTFLDLAVSMDADGDAVVAYTADSKNFFGGHRIYVSRISKAGVVSDPLLVGA